jgi:hypothetical protein
MPQAESNGPVADKGEDASPAPTGRQVAPSWHHHPTSSVLPPTPKSHQPPVLMAAPTVPGRGRAHH